MIRSKWNGFGVIILLALLTLPPSAAGDEIQLSTSQSYQGSGIKAGLRLMGGGFLVSRNDLYEHIQGMYDFYEDEPFVHSMESEGFGSLNIGLNFSGELFFDFTENIGIGVGAGYITHENQRSITRDIGCGTIVNHDYYPKFSAVPLTFSLYLGLPVWNEIKIVFNVGAGYYLGKMDWVYEESTDPNMESNIDWSARSNTLGFHGGMDFEYGLTSHLAFVVGAKGRYAKINGLTGDYNSKTKHPLHGISTGTLRDMTFWFGTWKNVNTGEEYPKVVFSPMKPSGIAWSDEREGELNLSGVVFQAGLKVAF
jgi:hypothetical protein